MEMTVRTSPPTEYRVWQSRHARQFAPDQRRRLEDALQDIRLKIMGDREASGSEGIDAALRSRIDGWKLREVLQLGLEARIERSKAEADALDVVMRQNSMLQTRPGDNASEQHLVGVHQRQWTRLEELHADIATAERELAPLLKLSGRRRLEPPADSFKIGTAVDSRSSVEV